MIRKILFGIIALFFLCSPVSAENFYIENYDVIMNVTKQKQVHITETISAYFTQSSHGIYRDIPHKNGTITNINVSENYTVEENSGVTNIKIGYPYRYVNGRHVYTISYDYNIFDNKNEFYFNIIGTEWTTQINHATFKITMPETVDPSKVGLSIGSYGTVGFNGGAQFQINDNIISGEISHHLYPGEGATIRIELPQNYFEKTHNIIGYILICLICITTLISFIIWYIFGKDEKAIPFVNFYPPKGMNTLEIEIAYKEHASTQGLVAMLITLAQRGYIKIVNKSNDDFSIYKIKNYDGTDKLEHLFMLALFKQNKNTTSVSKWELEKSTIFYKECENIIEIANSKKNNLYEKSSLNWTLRIIMFLCLAINICVTSFAIANFNISEITSLLPILIWAIVALTITIINFQKQPWIIIWGILMSGVPLLGLCLQILNVAPLNLPVVILGAICTIICFICLYHLRKRNDYALRLLAHLLGFKKFIDTAEKHRLQSLVDQNPQYFYDVLPFAYLFGISDKWIKKFEEIMTIQPDWYSGQALNSRTFHSFSNSMNQLSQPSTENGGISTSSGGGGGFSGGGCGGGGGGSW